MKNGKKLTRLEKIALTKVDMNPEEWLRVKRAPDRIQIININSGKIIWLRC